MAVYILEQRTSGGAHVVGVPAKLEDRCSSEICRTARLDASAEGLEAVFYVSDHLTIVSWTEWNKHLLFSLWATVLEVNKNI